MKARIATFIIAALSLGAAQARAQDAAAPIGEPRDAAGLQSAAGVNAALRWAELDRGGHVAALRISSQGARALRAGIRVGELPRDATLRFYAPGDGQVREVSAASILDALARNRDAGETGPDARTWWSPLVEGDTLVVEIELAPGSDPAALAIAVPSVSHIREWAPPAGGDARTVGLVTTLGGTTYACAGEQVAAAAARYFLAEDRCIATQAAASSLEVFVARDASGVGARLLYASPDTDTAFLALDAPPASPGVAPPPLAALDPALEQWLGAGGAARAHAIGAFSSP
jgi:hypothetical protein